MTVEILFWESIDEERRRRVLRRSEADIASLSDDVSNILHSVQNEGDAACREYTREFDKVDLRDRPFRATPEEFSDASKILPQSVKIAITRAVENVRSVHATQGDTKMSFVETAPGLYNAERVTPIPSVGLYVPRGRGSFPSMLYMLAIPAGIAGVPRIAIATPPQPDGSVDPACLYAAELCGVSEVYRLGGAQAIAAFAYGTESIPRVEKIVGPGSAYVAVAKRLLFGVVDVGIPAGPTESVILADSYASAWKVALDLTIEAEHGSDSQALLITPSGELAARVAEFLPSLIEELPEPRRSFVHDVFEGYGGIIVTESLAAAVELINQIAPEHLSIQTQEPFNELSRINHAGEILLGEHTPFSIANYATGANAVLPTGGKARTYGPVSVRDFTKSTSVVYATEMAMNDLADTVTALADYEGFAAHARSLRKRSGE